MIMMQCEPVVKMLLSGTGQVFQPVVFCRVISTMQGLMCFMVFHLALVRSLCLLAATITQAHYLTTTSAKRCQRNGVFTALFSFGKCFILTMHFVPLGWRSSCQMKQNAISQTCTEEH